VRDTSKSATDFILRCDAVVTISSGLALEAMLLGRRCVVVGDSPFRIAADRTLDPGDSAGDEERLLALNFLVFGYIVPCALMFDPAYSRWRLTGPSELEIVRGHQRWYANRMAPFGEDFEADLTLTTGAKLLEASVPGTERRRLVLFGAGRMAPALLGSLGRHRFELVGVFDNDPAKCGARVADVTIGPPSYRDDVEVLVCSLSHRDEMVRQLQALGYGEARRLALPGTGSPSDRRREA